MDDMPRPRPPYLHHERTRHGKWIWYVRVGKGARIRLHETYGTPEFAQEYQAAVSGNPIQRDKQGPRKGSLAWLIDQYKKTAPWAAKSPATRRKYGLILAKMASGEGGNISADMIKPENVRAGMDKRAATPFEADNFLKAVRGLFAWALEAGHITADPTTGVKAIKAKTKGFHTWTEAEIDKFEAYWKIGTRERLAMALFLYSGLRRGDVALLERQHIGKAGITIRTEKTDTALVLPILPVLQTVLDASTLGERAIIASKRGGGHMTKEGLGNWFAAACQKAGVPGSAHGLRKAGARRAAENGATQQQLKAVFGWTDDKTAAVYVRDADRARMARDGMVNLLKSPSPIPEPHDMVRASAKKSQQDQ